MAGLFSLMTVTQTAHTTIRVRFTQELVVDDSDVSALNLDYWALSGPDANYLTAVNVASDDPQSIDLTTKAPLATGTWTVSVSGLEDVDGTTLETPAAGSFATVLTVGQRDLAGGAINDTSEEIIRKHLSPALKGPNWDAVIKGLASGDAQVRELNALAFDQTFKSTASGLYLDRKSADDGIQRPSQVGMSDELFRDYSIKATTGKITQSSVLEMLEVFYGPESVRAYIDTELVEPFNVVDGAKLIVLLDERDRVEIVFNASDFDQNSNSKAIELALVFTRAFRANGHKAYALPVVGSEDGLTRVRIYSGSLGLGSGVRVLGGLAQDFLKFPETINVFTSSEGSGGGEEIPGCPAPGLGFGLTQAFLDSTIGAETSSTGIQIALEAPYTLSMWVHMCGPGPGEFFIETSLGDLVYSNYDTVINEEISIDMPAGEYTINLIYAKYDNSANHEFWIDNFRLTQDGEDIYFRDFENEGETVGTIPIDFLPSSGDVGDFDWQVVETEDCACAE